MQMLLEETGHRARLAQLEVPILEELSWQEAIRLLVTISGQETGKLAHYKFAEAFNGIPFGTVGVIADLMKDKE
jgi:hypothetical protein